MKAKAWLGEIIIIIISLIPVLLLLVFGPGLKSDYSSLTHFFGQVTALVSVTMFALTFVLSTRLKFIENLFGGLDKVYVAHGHLGGTALILILFHPVLLVLKFVPANVQLAVRYIMPSDFWSVNFGIIALLGLIVLVFATLYIEMKYHRWKISHEFLGLVFIFAVLHIFLIRQDAARDYIFHGYYTFTTIVAIIGLGAFFYTLFLRRFKRKTYLVKSVSQKSKELQEIVMVPKKNAISYHSGQFIFVKFFNKGLPAESHPFSIASGSNSREIRIFIKNLGDYTCKVGCIKKGDVAKVEGPYGRFYSGSLRHMVWVAGGIGITPFLGIAKDLAKDSKVDLFYTVREEKDFVGLDELNTAGINLIPWVSAAKGRLDVQKIIATSGTLEEKEFWICGPKPMMDSIVKGLLKLDVPINRIHWEEFGFK